MRRGLVVAVLLCLAGAGLLLLATSRTWLTYEIPTQPPLPGRSVVVTGAELAPGARALALLGLAGVAALPATRSWGRRLVGVVVAGAGVGAAVVLVRVLADPTAAVLRTERLRFDTHLAATPSLGGWPYVGIAGSLLLVAAGLLALVRGGAWSAMGSSYDAPTAAPTSPSAWDALDQGVDPTA